MKKFQILWANYVSPPLKVNKERGERKCDLFVSHDAPLDKPQIGKV